MALSLVTGARCLSVGQKTPRKAEATSQRSLGTTLYHRSNENDVLHEQQVPITQRRGADLDGPRILSATRTSSLRVRFFAISISGGLFGTPLVKIIIDRLRQDDRVLSIEIRDVTYTEQILDLSGPKTVMRPLASFLDLARMRSQSRGAKIAKWFRFLKTAVWLNLRQRNAIFYTTGHLETLILALCKVMTLNGSRLVYHQFEMVPLQEHGTVMWLIRRGLQVVSDLVDNVVMPEETRACYLAEAVPGFSERVFVCPNTTVSAPHRSSATLAEGRLRLLHVGSAGEATYWREIVELAARDKALIGGLTFIGRMSQELRQHVARMADPEIRCLEPIPHKELVNIYPNYNVGLVLYRSVDLSTRLAAPNKMYEFWSHGLPVLAPNSPSMASQFRHPVLGQLVDFTSQSDLREALLQLRQQLSRADAVKAVQDYFDANLEQSHFIGPLVEQWLTEPRSTYAATVTAR